MSLEELTRPIIGLENRTPQEVFDIMKDRILKGQLAKPDVPDGWKQFVSWCADQSGNMVSGNRLSIRATKLLNAAPQPESGE